MAESILQALADGRVRAHSAGSHPTGRINPLTFDELVRRGYPTQGLSSKSWLPFLSGSELQFDFVISVCDQVAFEGIPSWPGNPRCAAWQLAAPGAVQGSDAQIRQAFSEVCDKIEEHVRTFLSEHIQPGQQSAAALSS